jgi:hypothetical protein
MNRGADYGLEIPLQHRFSGAEKAVDEWVEKNIKKPGLQSTVCPSRKNWT